MAQPSGRLVTCLLDAQAVRASSAAPYYFDEFGIGEDRWQDGATMANNPTLVALQQVRVCAEVGIKRKSRGRLRCLVA
jgi:predicted acylesterase/phospholipase RssA